MLDILITLSDHQFGFKKNISAVQMLFILLEM